MEIYVGNLPPRADTYDLRRLFDRELRRARFQRLMRRLFGAGNGPVRERFRVVAEEKPDGLVRYGRVVIEPDELALLAMHRLNHTRLHGHTLVMREFHSRAYANDRRSLHWRNRPWPGPERRRGERRRAAIAPLDHPDF